MIFPRSTLAALLAVIAAGPAVADVGVVPTCPLGQTFTAGAITVTGAFLPATPKGAPTAAAYMQIANGGEADTLEGATSLAANSLTLHQMKQTGSVMQMAPVDGGLPVPANGTVSLDPMAYHLMLAGLSQPLTQGECVEVTLHFARAGDLRIELNVGGMGSTSAPGMDGMSSMAM